MMGIILKTKGTFILSAVLTVILIVGYPQGPGAKERDFHPRQYMDSRHNHNRQYPAPGQSVDALPQGHRAVFWGKERYHFFNGVWYRPVGRQFLVVTPPIGLIVPSLPSFHTTLWVNSVPYYYANQVYYTQSPVGYVVAGLPKGEISQTPPGPRLFIYPRYNQSDQIQDRDRHECQTWAERETNFNPTKTPPGMSEAQQVHRQDDYHRAMGACLEAKGYSVK
jgi:hypothetical protein